MPQTLTDETDIDVATAEIQFSDVLQITRDIFGGAVRIEVDPDPEIMGLTNIVFCAEFNGTPRETVDRSKEWHVRLDALYPIRDRRLGLFVEPLS